jgi:hypothetical protein
MNKIPLTAHAADLLKHKKKDFKQSQHPMTKITLSERDSANIRLVLKANPQADYAIELYEKLNKIVEETLAAIPYSRAIKHNTFARLLHAVTGAMAVINDLVCARESFGYKIDSLEDTDLVLLYAYWMVRNQGIEQSRVPLHLTTGQLHYFTYAIRKGAHEIEALIEARDDLIEDEIPQPAE